MIQNNNFILGWKVKGTEKGFLPIYNDEWKVSFVQHRNGTFSLIGLKFPQVTQ